MFRTITKENAFFDYSALTSLTDATGGEDGPRTHNLLNAIQTLSQTELQPHIADRLCVHDHITYWISNRISQNSYDLLSWWSTHSRVLNDPAFFDSSKNNYNHMVPKAGLEPARVTPPDFESGTSTNSITRANDAPYRIRTYISDLFWSQMFSNLK